MGRFQFNWNRTARITMLLLYFCSTLIFVNGLSNAKQSGPHINSLRKAQPASGVARKMRYDPDTDSWAGGDWTNECWTWGSWGSWSTWSDWWWYSTSTTSWYYWEDESWWTWSDDSWAYCWTWGSWSSWWTWSSWWDSSWWWYGDAWKTNYCSNSSINATLEDSFGDGWNSHYFSLYLEGDFSKALQTVTLEDGSYNQYCLDTEWNSCYVFAPSSTGWYLDEISWTVCGETGGAETGLYFCLDGHGECANVTAWSENCDNSTLPLRLSDTYGDGWNGMHVALYSKPNNFSNPNNFSLAQTVTLEQGYTHEVCLDVDPNTCYKFATRYAGWYPSENYWNLCGVEGYSYTSLVFCTDSEMNCVNVTAVEDYHHVVYNHYGVFDWDSESGTDDTESSGDDEDEQSGCAGLKSNVAVSLVKSAITALLIITGALWH